MNVKEKLVELLGRVQQMGVIYKENQMDERYPTIEQIRNTEVAARLIAYGVTVQEWISVEDRLPEPFVSVLVHMPGEEPCPTVREGFISNDGIWQSAMFRREPGEVTHWKPMPVPPKGE